jgi:threonine synthase
MRFVSTRGTASPVSFSEAAARGLAPDGGLYAPEALPRTLAVATASLPETAQALLAPFFAGDALEASLPEIVREAFNFPVRLAAPPGADFDILELFYGPTAAFKDFGARFLAAAFSRGRAGSRRSMHVLVATSGDTGGAVASAFHNRPHVRVSVLYPRGMVSPAQERQLTCWGDNVTAYSVQGTFDDCQRLVKAAFGDPHIYGKEDLSSANSINIGRLLPQMCYFAWSSCRIQTDLGVKANFVIPSGNLGHATACIWAREMGCPVGEIVLAHNANRTMPDYIDSGVWRPRPSVRTLASAMDVGDPSNAERLRFLFPTAEAMRRMVRACSIDDDGICSATREAFERHGAILCPHTAAGYAALKLMRGAATGRWVITATAHAAKFPEIVEPLIGERVGIPPALAALPPARNPVEIEANLDAFVRHARA